MNTFDKFHEEQLPSKKQFYTRLSEEDIPSRGLTYPTLGKGKSSSKCHFLGIC